MASIGITARKEWKHRRINKTTCDHILNQKIHLIPALAGQLTLRLNPQIFMNIYNQRFIYYFQLRSAIFDCFIITVWIDCQM